MVKVNCLCARHAGIWRIGRIPPLILNLDIWLRWVTTFTPRSLQPYSHWLRSWPVSRASLECSEKRNVSCSWRKSNQHYQVVQPVATNLWLNFIASYYTRISCTATGNYSWITEEINCDWLVPFQIRLMMESGTLIPIQDMEHWTHSSIMPYRIRSSEAVRYVSL
jgi:hypothetical protein